MHNSSNSVVRRTHKQLNSMPNLTSFTKIVDQEYQKILKKASKIFQKEMENLVVRTLWDSPCGNLYGQYYGVPTVKWAPHDSGRLPPEIVIFANPLLHDYPLEEQLRKKVHKVILHEIGHHLGMGERELRRKGIY